MTSPSTPQQLFAQLLAELSASGDVPINSSTSLASMQNQTLREAVGHIYWKETAVLNLASRPRSPYAGDDQFGHVLNSRAEGLQTLALVTALCESAKIDTAAILAQVTASFTPPAN